MLDCGLIGGGSSRINTPARTSHLDPSAPQSPLTDWEYAGGLLSGYGGGHDIPPLRKCVCAVFALRHKRGHLGLKKVNG